MGGAATKSQSNLVENVNVAAGKDVTSKSDKTAQLNDDIKKGITLTLSTFKAKVFNKEENLKFLKSFLSNIEVINDFYTFITNDECMIHYNKFFDDIIDIIKFDSDSILASIKEIFSSYQVPNDYNVSVTNNVEKYSLTKFTSTNQFQEVHEILYNISNEIFLILAMSQIQNYMKSKPTTANESFKSSLNGKSWFNIFCELSEKLPIVLSIASARTDRPNFKLVYVNNNYEKMTEYPRHEILGLNAKYLQAGKAEKETIQKMSNSLKEAKAINVSITNQSKNGRLIRNLLAMKPIYDQNNQYRFVFGMQFDSSVDDVTLVKFKLCYSIFKILPTFILCRDDE